MLKSRGNSMIGAARRLRQLRRELHYSPREMAEKMGVQPNAYYKNESGETLPGIQSLQRLQKEFGISMDWFLFNSGPKYLKEKQPDPAVEEEKAKIAAYETAMPDVRELLEHMEKDPVLRHRLLLNFYEYKNKAKPGSSDTPGPG